MTGQKIKKVVPIEPDPSPTPVLADEITGAKKRVRAKKRGRRENILAGRMMQSRQILNTGQLKLGA